MEIALKTLHILCMIGAFGALAAVQFGLDRAQRSQTGTVGGPVRLANILIGVGFIAGLAFFLLAMRGASEEAPLPANFHMLVGIKFLLLFAVGALAGISGAKLRKGRASAADGMRIAAIALLALGALLGVLI